MRTQNLIFIFRRRSRRHGDVSVYVSRKRPLLDSDGNPLHTADGLPRYTQKKVGSFQFGTESIPLDILDDHLTEAEKLEIRKVLYTANFAKQVFKLDIDELDREIIKLPANLLAATDELSLIALQEGIEFNPHQLFITSLMQALGELEKTLSQKTGKHLNILQSHQVIPHA